MTIKIEDRAHLLRMPYFIETKCGKKAPLLTEERTIKINSGEIPKCHACYFAKPARRN